MSRGCCKPVINSCCDPLLALIQYVPASHCSLLQALTCWFITVLLSCAALHGVIIKGHSCHPHRSASQLLQAIATARQCCCYCHPSLSTPQEPDRPCGRSPATPNPTPLRAPCPPTCSPRRYASPNPRPHPYASLGFFAGRIGQADLGHGVRIPN